MVKYLLAFSLAFFLVAAPCWCESQSPSILEGGVQEQGSAANLDAVNKVGEQIPSPVLKPAPAQIDPGWVQDNQQDNKLKGNVRNDDGLISGKRLARPAPPAGWLQGNASSTSDLKPEIPDPDADNAEVMIQWDRWRNRLLMAIQSGTQEGLNHIYEAQMHWDSRTQTRTAQFPLGTIAWFYCQVTPDRRILDLKLTRSSGYPDYDHAVIEAIKNLEGSSILRYPTGSRRTIVSQEAGIKTVSSLQYNYFHFGDVERRWVNN